MSRLSWYERPATWWQIVLTLGVFVGAWEMPHHLPPSWTWGYELIVTLLIVAFFIWHFYRARKRELHRAYEQGRSDAGSMK